MATKGIEAIQVGPLLGLSAVPMLNEHEADSQTFDRGGPLKFSSGKLTEAGASVGSVQKIRAPASDKLLGFATADGQNTTSAAKRGVALALPGVTFVGNVYHGTAASAVLAQSQIGTAYGLREHPSSADKWVVNLEESSASVKCVKIVGLVDAVGDKYGRAIFTVLNSWQEMGV